MACHAKLVVFKSKVVKNLNASYCKVDSKDTLEEIVQKKKTKMGGKVPSTKEYMMKEAWRSQLAVWISCLELFLIYFFCVMAAELNVIRPRWYCCFWNSHVTLFALLLSLTRC